MWQVPVLVEGAAPVADEPPVTDEAALAEGGTFTRSRRSVHTLVTTSRTEAGGA